MIYVTVCGNPYLKKPSPDDTHAKYTPANSLRYCTGIPKQNNKSLNVKNSSITITINSTPVTKNNVTKNKKQKMSWRENRYALL